MLQDRFGKIMLVLIAALLAANLLRSGKSELVLPIESTAQAQNIVSSNTPVPQKVAVKTLQGFTVADLKDVVSLGDGRTFIVSNTKGFMVYTVVPAQ
jgi:hypothetical protein